MAKFLKNKRIVMATSLLIGVMMLSIPTFAEMNQKSGYDKLKDSLKATADTLFNKSDNFTGEISFTLKDNDNIIIKSTTTSKIDTNNNSQESTGTNFNGDKEEKSYYYMDSNQIISLNSKTNEYYITEYTNPITNNVRSKNPFNDENASDIEKIIDAAVSGIKDNVVSEVKADGSMVFSGNITDNQVPAIINTVSSYLLKTQINNEMRGRENLPLLTKDIYIKNVTGKANADKYGILENVFVTFVMSGKEKDGTSHELTVDVLADISNINNTIINPPDLTGKNVQTRVAKDNNMAINSELFAANYKNDIVILEKGKYVKIGERFVTIAHADSKMLEGRYHEEYFKEYANKYKASDFAFAANCSTEKNDSNRHFIIKGSDGRNEGSVYLQDNNGNINFYSDKAQKNAPDFFNGEFYRIFN
jgi:hypothetical protein